jgi:ATP-dependent Lhr-like helicase
MGSSIASAVRDVLVGSTPEGVSLSRRANAQLVILRGERPEVRTGATSVVSEPSGVKRWWTFAGWKANLALAEAVAGHRGSVTAVEDLWIALDTPTSVSDVVTASGDAADTELRPAVDEEAIEDLKFSECLPSDLAHEVVQRRLHDAAAVRMVLSEPVTGWTT